MAVPADSRLAVLTEADEGRLATRLERLWATAPGIVGWLSTVDHKEIGKRYIVTAMLFLIAGGIEALVMRVQLAGPDQHLLTPEQYNMLFTMHGASLIFWYASPVLSATICGRCCSARATWRFRVSMRSRIGSTCSRG